MDRRTKIGASIAAGATAVVAVAAIAVASPSATRGDDATPNPSATSAPQQHDEQRTPETPLTGAAAEDASAAALEAVPGGTVLRVETDSDGGGTYEAHVRKSDGTEVIVLMDEDFTVTSVEEFAGRGGHGPRGGDQDGAGPRGGHRDGDDSSAKDGASAAPSPSA